MSILLGSSAIYFLPLKYKIDKTLDGFQTKIGHDEYNEKITIEVKGTYNKYLMKNDTFKGSISTNLHGEVWDITKGEIVFYDNMGNMSSWTRGNDGQSISEYFGNLICEPDFSEVLLLVHEQTGEGSGWSGEDGLYISAPAKNKEESIKIARKLGNKNELISKNIWE